MKKPTLTQTTPKTRRNVSITIHVAPETKAALQTKAAAGKTSMSETAAGIITREIQAEQAQRKGQPLY